MSLYYNNNMIGQAEREFESYQQYPTSGKSEMGKDDFLLLLVEQMKNQDPMNPMEDKEFTAQLANFSSLEQLTEINDGIGTLTQGTQRQEMLNAVSFIGKEVMARGQGLSKMDDMISTMSFNIDQGSTNTYVNIFDEFGNIVKTLDMGALAPGEYDVEWDGTDYQGRDLPNGVYSVAMAAENAEGEPILVDPEVSGVVEGVNVHNGGYWLKLKDGREVNLFEIKTIVGAEQNAPTDEEETT